MRAGELRFGQLLERLFHSQPQLVAFFAHQAGFGTRRRELKAKTFDLASKLAQPRVGPGCGCLDLSQLETQAFDGDLQRAALREQLAVCLLVDSGKLYRFPFETTKGIHSLEVKARYLRGEMEHLRLREFQPGLCRYVERADKAV